MSLKIFGERKLRDYELLISPHKSFIHVTHLVLCYTFSFKRSYIVTLLRPEMLNNAMLYKSATQEKLHSITVAGYQKTKMTE